MNRCDLSDTTAKMQPVQVARQFVIRRPTMQDAAAVTGLINICAVAETGALNMTVAALEVIWREAEQRLTTDAWVVLNPAGRVVGYGELACEPACTTPYVWVYVHPDQQATGIGAHLFRTAEMRVRQLLSGDAPGQPVIVRAAVVSFNQSLRRLLHTQGFALAERHWRASDAPPVSTGIMQRAYTPGDDGRMVARVDVYEKMLTADERQTTDSYLV
ncbi:GNAT family N-acetyltransferase [Chloroflexota bacterium]